jgi:hypothetical protein
MSLRAVLALWLGITPGCMTIISQEHYWSHNADAWMFMCMPEFWIYGGTVNEACLIGSAFIPGLIDLPLCLAADTLLLPLTVYQQITYTPPEKPEPEEESDTPRES